jgi:transcriptional regulator with XRE-family HTH domain
MHPEERRIAGLLRELIVQSGAPLETLESRLGWEPGHLSSLLEGKRRLNFEDTLEILPLLGTTPTDFFAWLYGFEGKEPVRRAEEELAATAGGTLAQRALDHRFDQSLRVVKAAIARRQAWKEERARI